MSSHEPTDDELLRAWRAGDAPAGRRLVERHYRAIERFFVNKAPPTVAVDLIQTTFLKLVESQQAIDEDRGVRPYLFGIARNVLYMHLRTHWRDANQPDFETCSLVDLAPTATGLLAREQQARLLLEGLRRIPVESQIILELTYWEGLRGHELAALLDVPLGTARTRLRKARQQLERALTELAESPQLLHSTMSNLDDWVERLREQIHAEPTS